MIKLEGKRIRIKTLEEFAKEFEVADDFKENKYSEIHLPTEVFTNEMRIFLNARGTIKSFNTYKSAVRIDFYDPKLNNEALNWIFTRDMFVFLKEGEDMTKKEITEAIINQIINVLETMKECNK